MKLARKCRILEYAIEAGAARTRSVDEDEGLLPDVAVRVGVYFQPVAGRNIFDGLRRHGWGGHGVEGGIDRMPRQTTLMRSMELQDDR